MYVQGCIQDLELGGGGGGGGQIELPKILGGAMQYGRYNIRRSTETGGVLYVHGNAMYGEGVLYSR